MTFIEGIADGPVSRPTKDYDAQTLRVLILVAQQNREMSSILAHACQDIRCARFVVCFIYGDMFLLTGHLEEPRQKSHQGVSVEAGGLVPDPTIADTVLRDHWSMERVDEERFGSFRQM